MIWNLIPNDERLYLWKKLRQDIDGSDLETQLTEVAKFCATMPIGSRTLDYYTPENWPTPWEILFYGAFCTNSISVFIFYTLTLLAGEKELELYLVDEQGDIYLLPVVDKKFVLNYHLGEVSMFSAIQHKLQVLKIYNRDNVKTIK